MHFNVIPPHPLRPEHAIHCVESVLEIRNIREALFEIGYPSALTARCGLRPACGHESGDDVGINRIEFHNSVVVVIQNSLHPKNGTVLASFEENPEHYNQRVDFFSIRS